MLMLAALIVAAFLGASAGLIWQNAGWLGGEDPEQEVVTAETPAG